MEKNKKIICKYEVTGVLPLALSRIVDEWWKAVLPFKIGRGKLRKVNVKMERDQRTVKLSLSGEIACY